MRMQCVSWVRSLDPSVWYVWQGSIVQANPIWSIECCWTAFRGSKWTAPSMPAPRDYGCGPNQSRRLIARVSLYNTSSLTRREQEACRPIKRMIYSFSRWPRCCPVCWSTTQWVLSMSQPLINWVCWQVWRGTYKPRTRIRTLKSYPNTSHHCYGSWGTSACNSSTSMEITSRHGSTWRNLSLNSVVSVMASNKRIAHDGS